MIFGFISGLVPGLHSNTIISILSSLGIDNQALAIIIISLYPVHLVTSFIPAIFFGIPESTSVVAVLPGQRMVLKGRGIEALNVVLISCLSATIISVILIPAALKIFPWVYTGIRSHMQYILLVIAFLLISRNKKPHLAFLVFLGAGILGYISLNSSIPDPFLPLFSGMFALATIINYQRSSIPSQKDCGTDFGFLPYVFLGIIMGFLADLVPGVGSPSQVATFATIFMPLNTIGYLAAISSISASEAVFSLATSASIGKSRIGATVWLADNTDITANLVFLALLFMISMSIAVVLLHMFRQHISKLAMLDFSKMNIILGLYLASITIVIDGIFGIVVFMISGMLGWVAIKMGVSRINLMGAIILPTLLLLFRINI